MKGSLIKAVKVDSLNLKCTGSRILSHPGGDVMETKWFGGHQKNFTQMTITERAYSGCHNPTATPRQRQVLALLMSRH